MSYTTTPIITSEQLNFIASNPKLDNLELATILNLKPTYIANIKSRLRKHGVRLPKFNRKKSLDSQIRALAKEYRAAGRAQEV